MKKLSLILAFFSFVFNFNAQINLVPNGSFEQVDSCYDYSIGIPAIAGYYNNNGWISGRGSADFYVACNTNSNNPNSGYWGTPNNRFGIQKPEHGNNYAGIFTYILFSSSFFYTEHLTINLTTPLSIGQKYFFSMYISLADSCNCASNNLGINFRTHPAQSYSNSSPYWNVSKLKFTQRIIDTASWVALSGNFTSDSSYTSIYIGNFYNNTLTDTLLYSTMPLSTFVSGSNWNQSHCNSYYYIDNIKLSTDSSFVVTNIIQNDSFDQKINIYPNPAVDFFYLTGISSNTKYEIRSLAGFQLLTGKVSENELIYVNDLPESVYVLQLYTDQGVLRKKIIINH